MSKRISILLLVASVLLLIPLIAMQFTQEVNWGIADFGVAGVLLFGTALSIEWALRKMKGGVYRILIPTILVILLLLVWAEMGVGLFNSPIAGD